MQKPDILIYQDYVHNNGHLYDALARYCAGHAVGYCDADDILNGILDQNTALLVMPGGADLYFCEKLNGAGNAHIRRYVESGGAYLGICAGAYYGCAALEWAGGTANEISGPRELGFYPGTAIGPIAGYIDETSWRAAIPLSCSLGDDVFHITSEYEAGPFFAPAPDDAPITVLARYENGHSAIVACVVGAGVAILSGPHIERIKPVLYRHNNPAFDREQGVVNRLSGGEHDRARVWENVLGRLLNRRQNHHATA